MDMNMNPIIIYQIVLGIFILFILKEERNIILLSSFSSFPIKGPMLGPLYRSEICPPLLSLAFSFLGH